MAKAKGKAKKKTTHKAARRLAKTAARKAARRTIKKRVPKKAARKASARRKPSVKKQAPPAALKRPTASSRARSPVAKKVLAPRAAFQATALTSAAPQAVGGDAGIQALQDKLAELGRIQSALRAQLGKSPADDVMINANIESLTDEQRDVQAQIAAAMEGTIDPPSAADVSALQAAIKSAETVIGQNATVDQLIGAAAALIKTWQK